MNRFLTVAVPTITFALLGILVGQNNHWLGPVGCGLLMAAAGAIFGWCRLATETDRPSKDRNGDNGQLAE